MTNWNQATSWAQINGGTSPRYTAIATDLNFYATNAYRSNSIAVDSNGNAHVVYLRTTTGYPWYSYGSTSTGWDADVSQPIQLDTFSVTKAYPSIDVDSSDDVQVIYSRMNGGYYQYIRLHTISSPYTSVASTASPIGLLSSNDLINGSIAADDAGNIHIVCEHEENSEIWTAHYNGSSWSETESMDTLGWVTPAVGVKLGGLLSVTDDIIVAPDNGADPDDVYYWKWTGSTWGQPETDTTENSDSYVSIEKKAPVGVTDMGYIVFDSTTSKLRFARITGLAEGSLTAVVNLGNHAQGQAENQFVNSTSKDDANLFKFQFTNAGVTDLTVDTVVFQLSSISGILTGDLSDLRIYDDTNAQVAASGGTPSIAGATGTITFSDVSNGLFDVPAGETVNYTLIGDAASLAKGDTVTIALSTTDVTLDAGSVAGSSPTNATHRAGPPKIATVNHTDGALGLSLPHQRRVVRDGDGYWYAVWADKNLSTTYYEIKITKSTNTDGTAWSTPVTLFGDGGIVWDNDGTNAWHPTIDIDRAGGVLHVVWAQKFTSSAGTSSLTYSKCRNLTNWSLATSWYQINGTTNGYNYAFTEPTYNAYFNASPVYAHSIAVDSSGNPHIGFIYQSGSYMLPYYIYGTTSWGTPLSLADTTTVNHRYPAVEVDSSDVVHYAWSQYYSTNYRRVYHKSAASPYTSFGSATLLVEIGTDAILNLSMAADDEGNVHLVCENDAQSDVCGAYYNGSTWTENESIDTLGWDKPMVGARLGRSGLGQVVVSPADGADPDNIYYWTWDGSAWDQPETDATEDTDSYVSLEKTVPSTAGDIGYLFFDAGASTSDIYFARIQLDPVSLADHDSGQVSDQFVETSPVSDVLFRFSLTGDDSTQVDTLDVNYSTDDGVADGDVTLAMLYADDGTTPGEIDGSDTLIQSGVSGSSGTLGFTTNFTPSSSGTDYLVKVSVANIASGDSTTFSMAPDDITLTQGIVGGSAPTAVTHEYGSWSAFGSASSYLWDVPAGVTSIIVKAWGGGGGGGGGGTSGVGGDGGGGGYSQATLSVTPGETLTVYVGGGGGGGLHNGFTAGYSGQGGGGGGFSGVYRGATELIMAGAGGGGGGGDNSISTPGGAGGAGGGTTADDGGVSSNAGGGSGGSDSAAGAGGVSLGVYNDGAAGSGHSGGAGGDGLAAEGADGSGPAGGANGGGAGGTDDVGGNGYGAGGGGGGGLYGGGGGGASVSGDAGGGGGGGGSCYVSGTSTTMTKASGATPANNSDDDYVASAGQGGSGGAVSGIGAAGSDGRIVILFTLPAEDITLGEHTSGQISDQFGLSTPVSEVLFRFKLTGDDSTQVDTLDVNYTTGSGVVDGDVTSGMLYADTGTTPGVVDGSDTLIQSGISGSSGQLNFTTNFTPSSSGTGYLVKVTIANLAATDNTTFSMGTSDITSSGSVGGSSPTNATHTADTPQLTLGNHSSGQISDQFADTTPVSAVLFRFSITGDDSTQATALDVNYTTGSGVVDGDVTSGMLYADDGTTPGEVDGSDTLIESGIDGASGQLNFTTNFTPSSGGTDYLIKVTVANLEANDSTTFSMGTGDITPSAGSVNGSSPTNASHTANPLLNPLIAYSQNGTSFNNQVYYSEYDTGSWSTGAYAVTDPDGDYDQLYKVSRTNPDVTKQAVVWKGGTPGCRRSLYASIWDGTNWDDGNGSPYADVKDFSLTVDNNYRSFDAAFEPSGGDLFVVSGINTTNNSGTGHGTEVMVEHGMGLYRKQQQCLQMVPACAKRNIR